MILARDLDALFAWKAPEGHAILSLYLDRKAARGLWSFSDCQPILKKLLKDLENEVTEPERPRLQETSRSVLSRLMREGWTGRSLAVFAPSNGDPPWLRALNVPVRSQAHWGSTPYLRPLVEALGDYERYGVVLSDKARARLFTIFLGVIEEERDAFNPEPVKHVASTGSDQARTMNLQRRSEEHARSHLRHVAEMLDRMERSRGFDRLILGGAAESVHQLRRLLAKRLASRIVGTVNLPVEASTQQVLAETLSLEKQAQRDRQQREMEELLTSSAKGERAVAGLQRTLDALRDGRVWRLLYVEDLALAGHECPNCGSLFDGSAEPCALCGKATRPIEDLVERMAEAAQDTGAHVEPVGGAAAEQLREVGGVGAFLRF
jgi:peptide subunit release factor 1 (eRF1)